MKKSTYTVNGLTEKEICILYEFLVNYENKYKSLNSQSFIESYPNFKEIENLLVFDKRNKVDMKDNISEPEINHVYMTESKQLYTFLKHLRNAFAHSQLIKNDTYIILRDHPLNKSSKNTERTLSSYGKISNEVFDSIINFLSKQI